MQIQLLTSLVRSSGYQRLKENVTNGKADNHEAIDLYRPVENPDKTKPLWGENQWPSVADFRAKYEIWIEKMKKLGMIVMEAYACFLCRFPFCGSLKLRMQNGGRVGLHARRVGGLEV